MKKKTTEQIQARDLTITGQPPRIAPLGPEQYGEKEVSIVNEIRRRVGATPLDELPEYFATMIRHPKLMQRQIELSLELLRGVLPPRDREIVILRVAWLNQAPYEWGEHVEAAKRMAGLTSEEIERITLGAETVGWSSHERSLLNAVDELTDDAMISDGTWSVLAHTYDEKQLIELLVLVGVYQGVAYLQNSARFRLMAGNEGLSAR